MVIQHWGRYNLIRAAYAVAIFILLAVFVLHVFHPDMPQPGLDASWVAVTGQESARRTQWGVDLTFTYGPAAPVVTHYFNSDYLSRTLPLMLLIIASFSLLGASIFLPRRGSIGKICASSLLFLLVLLMVGQVEMEWVYYGLSFMTLVVGFKDRDALGEAALLLASLVLGLLPLTKSTFAIGALPLLLVLDIRQLLSHKIPRCVPLFFIGFFAAYVSYGQDLANFGQFVFVQFEVIRGYSEAMSVSSIVREIVVFAVISGVWFGLAVVASWKGGLEVGMYDKIMPCVSISFLIFLIFKAGFVRQDLGHVQIALTSLAIFIMIYSTNLIDRSNISYLTLNGLGLLVAFGVVPRLIVKHSYQVVNSQNFKDFYKTHIMDPIVDSADSFVADVIDIGNLAHRLQDLDQAAWNDVRLRSGSVNVSGSVDVIPSEQIGLIASGLNYRPRPSFQEYSTYTKTLIAKNQAFFSGSSAPDWVVFAPGSIDDRYPAFAEGPSWPIFLTRYEPERLSGEFVILKRRAKPLGDIMRAPEQHRIRFGEPLGIEQTGPLFAFVDVKKSLIGELINIAFRPPILTIVVTRRNGKTNSFRFIPAIAKEGFLLSPTVEDSAQFAALGLGLTEKTADNEVTSMSIETAPWARAFFNRDIDVIIRPLDTNILKSDASAKPFDLARLPKDAWLDLLRQPALRDVVKGTRLFVDDPIEVRLPEPHGQHLKVSFGLLRATWIDTSTGPVCFSISTSPTGSSIWKHCLDPVNKTSDRGDQGGEIDLPANLDSVSLKTSCDTDCAPGTAYWNGLESVP